MSAVPKPYVTPEPYPALERQAETKSEYFAGEIYDMAGGSREHNRVSGNVPPVERFARQASGQWLLTEMKGLEAVLSLPTIGCELALAEVYRKITFREGAGRR